jgi:8-oxo-dGTP diphosphatase
MNPIRASSGEPDVRMVDADGSLSAETKHSRRGHPSGSAWHSGAATSRPARTVLPSKIEHRCGRLDLVRDSVAVVHDLVGSITPLDALEAAHIADTLRWLESTDDVFRRSKPATPSRHLVSYVVLLDRDKSDVLLVDHVNAGLLLPPGGHVEPDEHPAAAARRECREELGIDTSFSDNRISPVFLTVTETVGHDSGHTDVSLWFISEGSRTMRLTVDEDEFRGARWWSLEEAVSASDKDFDPHFKRFLRKAFSTK